MIHPSRSEPCNTATIKHACQSGFKSTGQRETSDPKAKWRDGLKGQGGVWKASGHSEVCDHQLGSSMDTGESGGTSGKGSNLLLNFWKKILKARTRDRVAKPLMFKALGSNPALNRTGVVGYSCNPALR